VMHFPRRPFRADDGLSKDFRFMPL
jgi:hypothetical protein